MNELALFAGAGGGILGGQLLGWRTVCAVENDPYAASVLVARQNDGVLPPFPIWDDVRTFDGRPWRGMLMWFRAGSHAKHLVRRLEGETPRIICGRRCSALSATYAHNSCLPKTSAKTRSVKHKPTLPVLDTRRSVAWSRRATWAQTILGKDGGWLPTPTTKANWAAASMQKWPSSRRATKVFGHPTPEVHEYLMGWPPGWTDLKPLGTGKYQSWLQSHGKSCPEERIDR